MHDPTPTVGGAAAGALTAVPFWALGTQLDALLLGLLGSFIAVAWFDELNSMFRAAASVAGGALSSGVFSSVLATGAWALLPENLQALIQIEALRMPIALVIGFLAPSVWPALKRRAERRAIGQGMGGDPT